MEIQKSRDICKADADWSSQLLAERCLVIGRERRVASGIISSIVDATRLLPPQFVSKAADAGTYFLQNFELTGSDVIRFHLKWNWIGNDIIMFDVTSWNVKE